MILAVLVLGLTAVPSHVFTRDLGEVHKSMAFNIFTASYTILVLIAFWFTSTRFPKLYNRWSVLAVEGLTWLFWLIAFSMLADFTRKTSWLGKNGMLQKRDESSFTMGSGDKTYTGYSTEDIPESSGDYGSSYSGSGSGKKGVSGWWAMCAVASAVGAIGWIVWTVTLVTVALAVFGKQAAGVEHTGTGEKFGKTRDTEMHTQSVGNTQSV
ncbi:hypothetical protein BJ508DRAFT_418041 [Ascobolus immersus RN42]|uniref:MARVEL domain-containing protein n=1 Tax=Ascobolus immersus RN42 TaxID=1160509 RepID=A0A3N4HPJ2_ASCIM|nr:hypothetical protein BJ508DRAFT_418041 [Ascobolus immersus RN42]